MSKCIENRTVETRFFIKKVFVGTNCVIKNSIILNEDYLSDNTYIENCIIESRNTIRATQNMSGDTDMKGITEKGERYGVRQPYQKGARLCKSQMYACVKSQKKGN